MVNLKLSDSDLLNKEKMTSLIESLFNELISDEIKIFLSDIDNRQLMVEQHGIDSFLMQEDKKIPVKHPKSGIYDCDLIYCARLYGKKSNNPTLYEQATQLYYDCNCKKQVMIEVEGLNKSYDLIELLDVISF